jgi:hypothetical protein
MRLIHGQLQLAFRDENMDLALGVLEELIELEAPPPFPTVYINVGNMPIGGDL